jgi:hypothetical protein
MLSKYQLLFFIIIFRVATKGNTIYSETILLKKHEILHLDKTLLCLRK